MRMYRVYFQIAWTVMLEDDHDKWAASTGSKFAWETVEASDKADAKIKAIQSLRKNNRGQHWIKDLNKKPFSCISKIYEDWNARISNG